MYYNSINIRVSSTLKIHKLYTMYVLNVNVMQMTQKGAILAIMPFSMPQVEFAVTKGVIRIRKSITETTQLPKRKGTK